MNTHICSLGTIHLVLSESIWQKMSVQREQFARWPASPAELASALRGFEQGVPALVQRGRGQHEGQVQILMCTPAYHLMVVPSKYNNGYFVPWMAPLDLHVHDRLVRGALWLRAPDWRVHTGYETLPRDSNNGLTQVLRTWQTLQSEAKAVAPPAYMLTPAQESYLSTISRLIDVTRQLMRDKAALEPVIGYRQVESTGEVRQTARDVYVFHRTSRTPRVSQGDFLCLRDDLDLRGRVFSQEGQRLTIKFEGPVDRRRIPEQGAFKRTISETPYRLQQEAVERLRVGEARNPHLLAVLVDEAYQPYHPASLRPEKGLNQAQEEAFHRSLTVPDLLLVLGPPGTGKTWTIAEIARQYGAGQRRALVTAKTHQAVDNVLKQLPPGLTIVRIGHEDRVSEDTRGLLIDAQATTLQATLLQRTEARAQALSDLMTHVGEMERQGRQLADLIAALEKAEAALQDAQRQLETTREHIQARYEEQAHRLEVPLHKLTKRLAHIDETLKKSARRRAAAEARRLTPLLGRFWAWWSDRLARRIAEGRNERRQAQAAYNAEARAYVQAWKAFRRALRTREYYQLEQHVIEAGQARQAAARTAEDAARRLDRLVAGLISSRPSLEPLSAKALRQYQTWFQGAMLVLRQQHDILGDWRARLESRTEELYPILIRFADVVGATCIGIATDPNFANVDFDLVIADEAGQIGLPDLLVPLVRARRALLVGDHHQLPPFVEDEVQSWLRQVSPEMLPDLAWVDEQTTEAEVIAGLLTQSAFEGLFPTAEPAHVVRFVEQRRMPEAVSDFVKDWFYDGQLKTVDAAKKYGARHDDPLFDKPLAFVDTSDLPLSERQEAAPGRDRADPEGWGMAGYINRLEATLIADIVAIYDQERPNDWVVIVPYRAQARLIRRELESRLPAARDRNLGERVATVDSFQGGQSPRVIYGFTRSNDEGKVGFLRELRRLNVAMTRAQEQLVLVGDAATLTRTRNAPFRDMMQALREHIQDRRKGEWVSYEECRDRLVARGKTP